MMTEHNKTRRFFLRSACGFALLLVIALILPWFRSCRTPSPSRTLLYAIKDNDINAVKAYLSNNGDPNIALIYIPESWATALHLAAREGQVEIVRLLLGSGANPNSVCSRGRTPLRWTAVTIEQPGQIECAKLLLEKGADPNATDRGGASILLDACEWGDVTDMEIAKLLIEHGADVNMADREGDAPLHGLAKRGAHPNQSIKKACVEVAQMLLDHGADICIKNKSGQTALDLARSSRYKEMIEFLENEQGASCTKTMSKVKLLPEKGISSQKVGQDCQNVSEQLVVKRSEKWESRVFFQKVSNELG